MMLNKKQKSISNKTQLTEHPKMSSFQELVDEIKSLKHTNELLREDFSRKEKAYEKEIFSLKSELRQSNKSREMERDTIKKLREENEELKTSVQSTENYWKSKFENAQKEVSRHRLMAGNLDEENKKLKEEIESLKKSNKQKTNIIRRIRAEAEAYTVMYDDGK